MRRFAVIILALMVGVAGCGKKKKDSSPESAEDIIQADTASIDPSAAPESLPTVDGATPPKPDEAQKSADPVNPVDPANPAEAAAAAPPTASPTPDSATPPAEQAAAATTPSEPAAPIADPTPPPASAARSEQPSAQMADYTVQKGDTLMKIAFNIYGDIFQWKNIYEFNKDTLKDASVLKEGTSLKYNKPASKPSIERNGDSYLIKRGDTLASIADDIYAKRDKWKKIYENNRSLIKDPNKIYAGFYLYYQITEEEKKEAESIKAKRGSAAPLGEAEKQPGSAPDSAKNAMQPDPSVTSADADGGLNALATTPRDGQPASDSRAPASGNSK